MKTEGKNKARGTFSRISVAEVQWDWVFVLLGGLLIFTFPSSNEISPFIEGKKE